jgi:UDPglucose 6-dehydrogenase
MDAMNAGSGAPCIVTDITSAEMIKYASNAFLATRISFINEMASLCERVGASIDIVSQGLAMDPRTGSRIYAGVGYGGSCFPKDVRALDHLALTSDTNVELLRSVITVNNRQRLRPLYALRERFNGSISGLRVAVLGLAFKPDTDDVREAPALDLIRALSDDGALVSAYDPQANETARRHLPASVVLEDNPVAATEGTQAVALITEWNQIIKADWRTIAGEMRRPRFLFDGRNALDQATMEQLGFEYRGVGRNGVVDCHVKTLLHDLPKVSRGHK